MWIWSYVLQQSKTGILQVGCSSSLTKLSWSGSTRGQIYLIWAKTRLQHGSTTIEPTTVVRNLGVYIITNWTCVYTLAIDMRLWFSSSSPMIIFSDVIVNAVTYLRTRNIAKRLLQLDVVWSNGYYTGCVTASSACCMSDSESWLSWSREARNERASLTTNRLPHQILPIFRDVYSSKQEEPSVHHRYTRSDIVSASSLAASESRGFESTCFKVPPGADQVWRKGFLHRRSNGLEQDSKQCRT